MSDIEEENENIAGDRNDDPDDEPSTSWGVGKKSGLKRKLVVDSDDEDHRTVGSGDEDSDDEDATGDTLEDDAESGDSDSSGTPGAETCAICLGRMRGLVGSPSSCEHTFCLDCILEWAKTNATCPQDRIAFEYVLVRKSLEGPVDRKVPVRKQEEEALFIPEENPTYCEVCNCCDREERLLLCDGCDLGYHLECLDPPLTHVPIEEWFCPTCVAAGVPRVVTNRQQNRSEVEVEPPRVGRYRAQSTSRQPRPRLIPRTGATERIRARIKHNRTKKKLKRKKRKERKRARIASGEEEDKRPPIKSLNKFKAFVEGDNDIDAEFADDERADLLLSGLSHQSARCPEDRRASAARLLRDAAFTPQPSYSGKSSSAIISRILDQTGAQEEDILSGILENQSLVFASSRKLALNSERKLTKQSGDEENTDNSFALKEQSIMSEPLPSRRAHSPKPDRTARTTDDRSASPSRSSYRHRPHSPPPKRRSCSPYRRQRPRSPYRSSEVPGPSSEHRSPLDSRRRSPQISYQRQLPRHNTWERRSNGSSSRKDFHGHNSRWSEAQEESSYQRQSSPHQRKSERDRNGKERSFSSQDDETRPQDDNRAKQPWNSHKQGQSSQDLDTGPSKESHHRRDDSPDRRHHRYSHRDNSPHRRNRSWEKDSHFHRRKHSPSRRSFSRDGRDREPPPHRSFTSERHRSRSRSRSRERERRHPSLEGKDRKPRSQWSFSYFSDASSVVPSGEHSIHSLHSMRKSPVPSNGSEKEKNLELTDIEEYKSDDGYNRASSVHPRMESPRDFENKAMNDQIEEVKFKSESSSGSRHKEGRSSHDKELREKSLEKKSGNAESKSQKDGSGKVKKYENYEKSNSDSNRKKALFDPLIDEKANHIVHQSAEVKVKTDKNTNDNYLVHEDDKDSSVGHSKKKKDKLFNSLFGDDTIDHREKGTDKVSQNEKENREQKMKSSNPKSKKETERADISNRDLFGSDSEDDVDISNHGARFHSDMSQSKLRKDNIKDEKPHKEESGGTSKYQCVNVKNGLKENDVHNGNSGRHLKSIDLFDEFDHEKSRNKDKEYKPKKDNISPGKGFVLKKKSAISTTQSDKEKELKERFMAGLAKGLFGKSAPIDKFEDVELGDGFYAPIESNKGNKSSGSHETNSSSKVVEKKNNLDQPKGEDRHLEVMSHKNTNTLPSKIKTEEKHMKLSSGKEMPKHLKRDPKLVSSLFGNISDLESSSDAEIGIVSSQEAIVDNIVKNFGKSPVVHSESRNLSKEAEKEKSRHKHSKHHDGGTKKDHRKEKDLAREKQEAKKQKEERNKGKEKESSILERNIEGSKTGLPSSIKPAGGSETNRKESDIKTEKKIEVSKTPVSGQQASVSQSNKKESDIKIKQQKAALEVKVVKEVKKFLDPYYRDKTISKDEYKEIVAKCVTKVVSAECGDIIETEKMRGLVEGYVKFYKHRKTKMQHT